jgi:phosphoserine phosphatase RsbU/P
MILIVDDEALNRKVLQWSLAKLGHKFVQAVNGHEAIERVSQGGIDCVILDLVMPELDGFGFLEWLLGAGADLTQTPVIVNSALTDIDSIKRALNMGAYDYFLKPLSPDALEILLPTKVRNAISSATANRALREQTRQLQAELASAVRFQVSMLPKKDDFRPLALEYIYQPCSMVGGDFFDVFRIGDGRICLFIGDVTGHGLKAGMMSLMVKSLLRELVLRDPTPTVLVANLNRALLQVFEDGHYITGVYGIFDLAKNRFHYANCGHPKPLFYDHTKGLSALDGTGNFLGLLDEIQIEEREVKFGPGDKLLLFTDGISESVNTAGDELQTEGLSRMMEPLARNVSDAWCRSVFQKIVDFHGSNEFKDDVLLVACAMDHQFREGPV